MGLEFSKSDSHNLFAVWQSFFATNTQFGGIVNPWLRGFSGSFDILIRFGI